jgi:hypothetical protein
VEKINKPTNSSVNQKIDYTPDLVQAFPEIKFSKKFDNAENIKLNFTCIVVLKLLYISWEVWLAVRPG